MIYVYLHKIPLDYCLNNLIEANRNYLSEQTKKNYHKYYHKIDQYRKLSGEIIVRRKISEVLNKEKLTQPFSYTKYKRPFLTFKENYFVDFNITHSGDWVAIALSLKTRVGIDIEKMIEIDKDVFKQVMSKEENLFFLKNKKENEKLIINIYYYKHYCLY